MRSVRSLWSEREARRFIKTYAKEGIGPDLALRIYTSRLLGSEKKLVQHGGGNTSLKTFAREIDGSDVKVLRVKGSGWDMASIEPAGLPAVRLEPLQKLFALNSLNDADMVNGLRANLLDGNAPNPSIETLLHAFLPHTFIDHTHANAVLSLTDQKNGEAPCREVFGRRLALVPYQMPGFALAKLAAQAFAANPESEGLILLKHGIFTFGATAREAYERMIEFVSLAEARIRQGKKTLFVLPPKGRVAALAEVAPILRGLLAEPKDPEAGLWRRFVFAYRRSPIILDFIAGREVARYGQAGVVTPDHVIRTKAKPLLLPAPRAGRLDDFRGQAQAAIARYCASYRAYFARNNKEQKPRKIPLDPWPRVVLLPGLGLIGLGRTAKEARIAADIAETAIEVILGAEKIGRFASIPERDMFDVEYWSLEQAKLGKGTEAPLAGQVVAITGGAGSIGRAIAKAFRDAGAEIALIDFDGREAREAAARFGGIGIGCDVTKRREVGRAFAKICETFGGLDILVSNAGAAWEGRIGEVADDVLRKSFEINFFAHQTAAQCAVKIFGAQGLGGVLLFNASKQAVNPGPDFGPYGLPKAATLFLSRQYALDYGAEGIRANAVNADRIRSGLLTDAMIAKRAKARGISEQDYMAGNLLRREVRPEDVAKAFLDLALAQKTTAAVMTVDGGNIAAALR
jgi:rhamnose utilization protein RhaD (predicted bifunctional aldolase and dehydrogenase)/NAD(P)-dependent dehydrogenase (short-subunit alcohol dehydrogenase family)